MGWGRIDDGFDEHTKVLALLDEEEPADAHAAITLWTLCFTWAHRNTRRRGKTPGLVPTGLPRRQLGAVGRDAAKVLVRHGLWDEHPEGWMIHDFAEYLPTEETRAARAEAGRRGAAKRWASKHAAESDSDSGSPDDGNLPFPDGKLLPDSYPADSNAAANDGSRARARRVTTGSTTDNPIPEPELLQTPSESGERAPRSASAAKAASAETGQPLTETQRSKRLTDAYAEAEPMCRWPAVNAVVLKAIRSRRFSDDEIKAALLRMAADNRSVTVDALRTELVGFPRDQRTRASPNVYRNPENLDDYDDWKKP